MSEGMNYLLSLKGNPEIWESMFSPGDRTKIYKQLLQLNSRKINNPGGSEGKAFACKVGDLGSIPGSGRSPGEGNGNLLQYYCLENPMDRGAW